MKAKKTKEKEVPKAFAGMALAASAGLSAIPSAIAAYQGFKAQKQSRQDAADIKAMMPSLTSQEDYYNFYQKQAQATNEAKMQNQLDQAIAAGSKTLAGSGSRGVLGGTQGAVGQAAQTSFQMGQQRQDKLLGAYEKMIQAKGLDRQMLMGQQMQAEQQEAAGLQTMLSGLQGIADIGSSAIMAAASAGTGLTSEQKEALDAAGVKSLYESNSLKYAILIAKYELLKSLIASASVEFVNNISIFSFIAPSTRRPANSLALSDFSPTIILVGCRLSYRAMPSRKNSGEKRILLKSSLSLML